MLTQALSTGLHRGMDAFFQLLNVTDTLMMSTHRLLLLIWEKDDSIVNAIADTFKDMSGDSGVKVIS